MRIGAPGVLALAVLELRHRVYIRSIWQSKPIFRDKQASLRVSVFVVPGLGRLKKVQRKARTGRNPQTGEAIQIRRKTVAKFAVAKSVKDAIAPAKK